MTVPKLEGIAREALDSIATLTVSAEEAAPVGAYALVRTRMALLLGIADGWRPEEQDDRLAELAAWPTSPRFSSSDRACLTMAEQFALDVSAVTDEQRADLRDALGDQAGALVIVLHAVDFELRLRAVAQRLFRTDPFEFAVPEQGVPLPEALNRVTGVVARLGALDPLTTELVRLRGARIHNCRMCKVLRHADALEAGGDEALFDRIDDYESSDLTERQKTALRLTDAILMRPGDLPAGLVGEVHEQFSPAEILELVLDVERNARNKVAVANATDADGVGEGLTVYKTPEGGFELVSAGPGASDPRGRF